MEKFTNEIISKCINSLSEKENKQKINKYIIEPLISNISIKLHPYLITIFIMYILILILIISIMFILVLKQKNN